MKQLPARLWQMREVRILAPLALIAGFLVLFIKLADEMLEGETHAFDTALLLAFRTADTANPIGPPWLEIIMADLTAMGGHTVLILLSLASIGYLLLRRHPASAAMVAGSFLGGTLLNHLLKSGFDRPRPDLVAHLVEVHTLSFPSGHAMLSAIIYLTLGALLARSQPSPALKAYIMALAVLATVMIGLSRIYLGVHWPTDVLAGWCVGAAWALACLQLLRYVVRSQASHANNDA